MAFGFPASYETTIDRAGSRQASRDAIIYTLEILGWEYDTPSADIFYARPPISGASWGEHFTVSLETPDTVSIKSSCRFFQLFDWGKNRINVKLFLTHYSQRETREIRSRPDEPAYLDEAGNTPVGRLLVDE